jgi:hypothetical protein
MIASRIRSELNAPPAVGSRVSSRIAETADSTISSSLPPSSTAANIASTTSRPSWAGADADQLHHQVGRADAEHDAAGEVHGALAALAEGHADRDDGGDGGERRPRLVHEQAGEQ